MREILFFSLAPLERRRDSIRQKAIVPTRVPRAARRPSRAPFPSIVSSSSVIRPGQPSVARRMPSSSRVDHRASLCSGSRSGIPPENVWIFRSSAATAATSVSRSARNRVASSSRADNADFAADKAAESFELAASLTADADATREDPRRRAPRRAPRDPRGAWRFRARGPPAMSRPRELSRARPPRLTPPRPVASASSPTSSSSSSRDVERGAWRSRGGGGGRGDGR